jgi:hypothetical protein
MKKSILIIVILSIAALCFAGPLQEMHKRVIAGSTVAAGGEDAWSCTDADAVCESFDATGYDNGGSLSATEYTSGSGTVVEDTADASGHGCDSDNTYVVDIDNNNTADQARIDWYSDTGTDMYAVFWFNVVDAPGGTVYLAIIGDATPWTDVAMGLRVDNPIGSNYDVIAWTHGAILGTESSLTINTWYKAEMSYDIDGNATAVINGNTHGPDSSHSWDPQYFSIGATDAQDDDLHVRFDAVKVDFSSMPSCDTP